MARGAPSLTALLGLLAIAGYQNRDKLAEMLGGLSGAAGGAPGGARPGSVPGAGAGSAGTQSLPGGLGGLLGSAAAGGGLGGLLSGGLKDLVDRFDKAGERETAQSWVSAGENKPCNAESLRRALGPETLADLREHTGLSDEELVSRLCRTLPEAVDRYTPEGRLP